MRRFEYIGTPAVHRTDHELKHRGRYGPPTGRLKPKRTAQSSLSSMLGFLRCRMKLRSFNSELMPVVKEQIEARSAKLRALARPKARCRAKNS